MRRLTLLLFACVLALTVGVAANHKTVRPQYQLLLPSGDWAVYAAGQLEWSWSGGSGTSVHESNRHGMLLFEVPIEVTEARLSAELGIYWLPDTIVPVSRAHPRKYPEFTMQVCR